MLNVLKWIATGLLIVGFPLFSAGIVEGFYIQLAGGVVWLVAATLMGDKPLVLANTAMTVFGVVGFMMR